jgi:ATP-dependent Zn protease
MSKSNVTTTTNTTPLEALRPLALLAAGLSGADIERLVREVRARCRRKGVPLTWDALEAALKRDDGAFSDDVRYRIAVHEIGHALCYEMTGLGMVLSVRLYGLGGKTETLIDREQLQFAEGMLDNLVAVFGGRAAEAIVFGEKMVGSGGEPQSDLGVASRIAVELETAFGLGENHPLIYRPPTSAADMLHYNVPLAERVHGRLDCAERQAVDLLQPHSHLLETLGRQLVEAHVLEGEVIRTALAEAMGGHSCSPP